MYIYSSLGDTIYFMVPASLAKNISHRMWQSNGKAFKTEKGTEWSIWTILFPRVPFMTLQVVMQKNWFILCYLFYSSFATINLGVLVLKCPLYEDMNIKDLGEESMRYNKKELRSYMIWPGKHYNEETNSWLHKKPRTKKLLRCIPKY